MTVSILDVDWEKEMSYTRQMCTVRALHNVSNTLSNVQPQAVPKDWSNVELTLLLSPDSSKHYQFLDWAWLLEPNTHIDLEPCSVVRVGSVIMKCLIQGDPIQSKICSIRAVSLQKEAENLHQWYVGANEVSTISVIQGERWRHVDGYTRCSGHVVLYK